MQFSLPMSVLDPFEVAEIEMWPFWEIGGDVNEMLNRAEFTVYCKALQASVFRAGLNENEIPVAEMIELPTSVREPILSAGDRRQREHPDLRLARRARTIANLARVMALLHDSTAARVGALFQLLVQDTTAQDFGLPSSAIRLRM